MKATRKQEPKLLQQLLEYDASTGELRWRERSPDMFADGRGRYTKERNAKIWNTKNAGNVAFTATTNNGYRIGAVRSQLLMAHRVAWAIFHGKWPDLFIDHINGDKTDNRISNLRLVDASGNSRNHPLHSNNTSGVTGVSWSRERRKWVAMIRIGPKAVSLGRFDNFEEAVAARKEAERRHNYHPNHGREARAS